MACNVQGAASQARLHAQQLHHRCEKICSDCRLLSRPADVEKTPLLAPPNDKGLVSDMQYLKDHPRLQGPA